ncbi:MAG: ATP-binding cassette domain-containing protein, partial [Actinobacteria bacterium]|nr:ATP-binding cassette domain-containing protein [Actinomycetota bacterium]
LSNMFMGLQVRGSGGLDRIREVIDQKITSELENIDGIAGVQVFGGRQKSIEIILDEDACRAYHITASQIQSLLAKNQQYKAFLGPAYANNRHYFVNLVAEYTDVSNIGNIVVNPVGPVFLKDVAEIYFGVKEQDSISRVNGKDAITIQLVRDAQVNLIDLSHATRDVIKKLNEKLKSDDVEIVIQNDSAELIEKNINLIIHLALIGGLLAVVVLWLFLRNLRWVFIITLAIPISIFTAFNFFYAFHISLNSITLIGMALAIGMLLDNSVVVLENIYRLLAAGKDKDIAVIQGTNEVWRSVFAATLTTITVFLPFIFASNFIIKILGKHIGVSIVSTLLVSLVVALFLIPMATHFFLQHRERKERVLSFSRVSHKNRLMQIYNLFLKSSIRYPARTIIGGVVVFFASLLLAIAVSLNVPEEVESKEFNLYVTMSRGATLDKTDAVVADIEKQLQDLPEKQDIISKIYEEDAIITIKLRDDYKKIKGRSIAQIQDDVQNKFDRFQAANVSLEQPQSSARFRGGPGRNPGANLERMLGIGSRSEKVVIKGGDFAQMRSFAEDIQSYLEDLSTMRRVNINVSDRRPEIHLYFNKQVLSDFGISLNTIASELFTFQNEFTSNTKFKQGTDEYDIVIKGKTKRDKTINDLRQLPVPDDHGGIHDLADLSRIVYSQGLSGINRVNQEKQIEVNYRFLSEVNDSKELLENARTEVDDLIANLTVPSGNAVEVVHNENDLSEFYFLIGAAFLLIYMILASVFESLLTPVVMMFTIPLAAIGSLWALILTANSLLNANTLIGFLILLGVVVNNGIIYIDYTRILRRRGYNRSRALIMAGQARIRPILITAITTIIAMFPLAMGKAEYVSKIGAPFAITVIGGLSLSTLFTLVFIPTVYSGLETALQWLRELNWKVKVIQSAAFIAGCFLIYENVDSIIWKFANLFVLILVIPGMTYFVLTSLRQAKEEFIGADKSIIIKIQHLVKIYDDDVRFIREWKRGKEINRKAGLAKTYHSWRDLDQFAWQIPLLAFLVYFVYFYLSSSFWVVSLSVLVYFYVLSIYNPIHSVLKNKFSSNSRMLHKIRSLLLWGIPLLNLAVFYLRWHKILIVAFIGILWFLGLAVYKTSNKIFVEKIDIVRLSGRMAGLQRWFYRFVQVIPIIGKKKSPFRALDGVSFEIGSGMFGLLGPNGAGKTTLMRIICGILEQSRGKIWINGLDLQEQREELQGLIGYLPQEFGSYENMTAGEFLEYQAILKNILDKDKRETRIRYVLNAVHMAEKRNDKIGSFSGGMKQRIGIAQTLLHLPRILVVDEPTAGLDPRERIRFRNLLVDLSRERVVIFSTHIIEDISSSCNRVAVLNRGKVRYLGEPTHMAELANNKVWQFLVPAKEFEMIRSKLWIIHHIRVDDRIRVRCLAEKQPVPDAKSVRPTLEDSYLWLLRKKDV